MFNHIIVPLDGSLTAQCALPAALSMAKIYEADIDLVHVLSESTLGTTTQVDPIFWGMRKVEIETYLNSLCQEISDLQLPARCVLLEGPVAKRLITHADTQDVDLIVISSHGHTGVNSWNVGSVAQKIISGADCSVLLMRAFQQRAEADQDLEPLSFNRILVPLDGSRRAECVLSMVNRLALAHNATVYLVHVNTPAQLTSPFVQDVEVDDVQDKYDKEACDYLQQKLSLLECTTHSEVLHGDDVVGTLNEFSAKENIDLIVLCAHGRSNSKRPYGSIVTSDIIHGDVSLLVIQDLQTHEFEPTRTESGNYSQTDSYAIRNARSAQPDFWIY